MVGELPLSGFVQQPAAQTHANQPYFMTLDPAIVDEKRRLWPNAILGSCKRLTTLKSVFPQQITRRNAQSVGDPRDVTEGGIA
jgi:hypothetical protein